MSATQLRQTAGNRAACSSLGNATRPRSIFKAPSTLQQRKHTVAVRARKVQVTGITVKSAQKAPARGQQRAAPAVEGSSGDGIINVFNYLCTPLSRVVGTPFYTAMQLVVLVGMLGVIDAAYSGDWSRIGVLTRETELQLQQIVLVLVGLHVVCGWAAAAVAQRSGDDWLVPAVKGFLFGTLGVYEQTAKLQ